MEQKKKKGHLKVYSISVIIAIALGTSIGYFSNVSSYNHYQDQIAENQRLENRIQGINNEIAQKNAELNEIAAKKAELTQQKATK